MPIPDQLVERIRESADIVEIVSEHTRLKRSGKTFRGPCPLHGGEGPNFSVDPGKGFYKCFVCGEGGTVFTFLMKHLGMTYPDAIRWVAARVGIEVPDEREERPEEDPHRHYYEVNAFARDWFRKQLWESDGGQGARDYLERRGVSREWAERFGLGWAPEEWTGFGDVARGHRIPNALLLELGLVKESQKGGREPYDAFRGRVIFPIEDLSGRVVAFGGRILGDAEEHVPKYLNSPETPVYTKGRTLYGLGWARNAIRREEAALVVEGYMDYVSLASHGVQNAVAPLGTAMTQEQAELIARYCGRAILLYDSDKAGLKATFRSGDELLRAGMEVLVATLPQGEDPDSLVRGKGPAALKKYLDDAVDVLERKIQILERKDFFGSIRGTRQAVDVLLPTVRATSDEVLRGVYIQRISEKTGVPRDTLEREVAELPSLERRLAAADPRMGGESSKQTARRVDAENTQHLGPERNILLVLLRIPDRIDFVLNREVYPDDFLNPAYRSIFQTILEHSASDDVLGIELFEPIYWPVFERLKADQEGENLGNVEQFLLDAIHAMRSRDVDRSFAALDVAIKREDDAGNFDRMMELAGEKWRFRKRLEEEGSLRRVKRPGDLRVLS